MIRPELKIPYMHMFLWARYREILKHSTVKHTLKLGNGVLIIDDKFVIPKNKPKMRMIGSRHWVHYTPKTLAVAMNTDTVAQYYAERGGKVL
tara:strand:+ start:1622 stop:1897 length:276 start_codon:yes stop_codon:yes gene_type:complete